MPRWPKPEPIMPGPLVEWQKKEGWQSFGNRLDFLSPEGQHAITGRLSILPRRGLREYDRGDSS